MKYQKIFTGDVSFKIEHKGEEIAVSRTWKNALEKYIYLEIIDHLESNDIEFDDLIAHEVAAKIYWDEDLFKGINSEITRLLNEYSKNTGQGKVKDIEINRMLGE